MRNQTSALIVALLMLLGVSKAQGPCDPRKLNTADDLVKDSLVIDARPAEVNKVRGKTAFKKQARVVVLNMNPFLFSYRLLVEQKPVEDRAALDFIKLLGSPISDLASIAPFRAVSESQDAEELKAGGNLRLLIERTGGEPTCSAAGAVTVPVPPPAPDTKCSVSNTVLANQALAYMAKVRDEMLCLKAKIEADIAARKAEYGVARNAYLNNEATLYSPMVDAKGLCMAVNNLFPSLTGYPNRAKINALKADIAELDTLILELKNSATAFKGDSQFADCQARSKGFNYADSLIQLAAAMSELRASFEKKAQAMSNETKAYDLLVKTIGTFGTPAAPGTGPGMALLQNTFNIYGQFDISALDIQLASESLQPVKPFPDPNEVDAFRVALQSSRENIGSGLQRFGANASLDDGRIVVVGDTSAAQASASRAINARSAAEPRLVSTAFAAEGDGAESPQSGGGNTGTPTKASAVIGARRFELSGGLVFASLPRREFKSVLGFARNEEGQVVDENGNPTDKRELTKIVGLTENSSRRIAPIVLLHTRLTNNPRYNMFFSFGITGKSNGGNFDLEYLVGPSFNFKNMFFTFGGYAGKQQRLAGDLFLGARLPDSDVPVINSYTWKPGFSFTYRIPVGGGPKTPE